MQTSLGWVLILFPGILFFAQLVSSINFPLAQRMGLQENPEEADSLLQRAEQYTANWDLLTLIWLPIGGVMMVANISIWPIVSAIGAAIYIDAAGREAVKILSFKYEGIRIGRPIQQRFFFTTYIVMAVLGIGTLIYSIDSLLENV